MRGFLRLRPESVLILAAGGANVPDVGASGLTEAGAAGPAAEEEEAEAEAEAEAPAAMDRVLFLCDVRRPRTWRWLMGCAVAKCPRTTPRDEGGRRAGETKRGMGERGRPCI